MVIPRTRQISQLRALLLTDDEADRHLSRRTLTRSMMDTIIRRRGRAEESRENQVRRLKARRLASAIRDADRELADNKARLAMIVGELAPTLMGKLGVGPVSAAQAVVSWSHRGRCRNEATFAALAGVRPIPASSGRIVRYRLNRGGIGHGTGSASGLLHFQAELERHCRARPSGRWAGARYTGGVGGQAACADQDAYQPFDDGPEGRGFGLTAHWRRRCRRVAPTAPKARRGHLYLVVSVRLSGSSLQ